MILVFSSFAREEARLAHVEVEALQAAIPETLELEQKQNVESAKINLHVLQKRSNNFWGKTGTVFTTRLFLCNLQIGPVS